MVITVNDYYEIRRRYENGDKNKILREDGEIYELSSYALFWNEDFYYVVGYSEKHENVSVIRVDRLYKPEVMDARAVKRPDDFNLDDYSKQFFEMYNGEEVRMKRECCNDLMKYITDRFGEDVETKRSGDDYFIATVDVALSPTFYGCVLQFGGGMRILTPKKAVVQIMDMADALRK